MASVHTAYGPGQVVETKTVRGRTEYRVAGQDFDVWLAATKVGFADVDHDNSVDLPYNPTPQYGVGALTDSSIQPIHEIDPDKRLHPADSQSFEDRSESEAGRQPGPNPDLFAKSAYHWEGPNPSFDHVESEGADADYDRQRQQRIQQDKERSDRWMTENGHTAMGIAMPSHHGTEADYEDAYPPGHELHHEDDYAAPTSGSHWDGYREQDDPNFDPESGDHPYAPVSADQWRSQDAEQNRFGSRTADVLEGTPTRFEPNFIVNDTEDEFLRDQDVEKDERETTGPDGIVHFASDRYANPLLLALPAIAEAVGGAGGAAGAAGAAEGAGAAGAAEGGLGAAARGLGADQIQHGLDKSNDAMDEQLQGDPLPLPGLGSGWGDLTHASLRPASLDARYADIHAAYDPYDKVAQFRHDPEAFINRVGHAEYEGLDPRMGSYVDMVDADEQLRTAAWKDVRTKAVRLRREGRVHVKDVAPDRIYASVEGDHGTYDVMIKKGGAFGGFGGGHAITNWHCACEWGKWAFQRRFTFVGRLCSHGYACYQEMQSAHMKGQPQKRRTKRASDDTTQDWKVEDTGKAKGALDELRNWAETPQEEDFGHMQERVEDIRDAVDKAREEGVDADQLVASLIRRHADTDDNDQSTSLSDMMSVPGGNAPQSLNSNPFSGGSLDPTQIPGVSGSPNNAAPAGGPLAGTPVGDMINGGKPSGPGASSTPTAPGPNTNAQGGSEFYQDNYGADGAKGNTGDAYTVKPGDTLSGIAESHGGGDYNSITNVGGGAIENKDLIQPGQKLDLSGVGGSGDSSGWGAGGSALQDSSSSSSSSTPGTQGPGIGNNDSGSTSSTGTGGFGGGGGISVGGDSGSTGSGGGNVWGAGSKSSNRRQADIPGQQPGAPIPGVAPAEPGQAGAPAPGMPATPAAPAGATPAQAATPDANTDAVGTDLPQTSDTGSGTGSGTSDPGSALSGGSPTSGTSDTGSGSGSGGGGGLGGFDMSSIGDIGGTIGDAVSTGVGVASDIAGAIGGILGSRQLEADRDWFEAAYPDAKFHDHKPFNGIGGENVTEWGQSKDNVKDNYADNLEDVTAEPKKTYLHDTAQNEAVRDGKQAMRGISRAGNGPQRAPVEPEVVRVRAPRRTVAAEADMGDFVDFDPLAPRTAASFDDPYREQAAEQAGILAAANGNDIVAQFQAGGGGAINAPVGASAHDDFSSSPVFRQAMQRTAGRNFSLAEQAALVREGDKGGAGNLDSLQLEGTHYEAMNSIGLW